MSPFSGTLVRVSSLPTLLLLDELNLVSARIERDLAQKYAVLRVSRSQIGEIGNTDVIVVSWGGRRPPPPEGLRPPAAPRGGVGW